MNLSAKSASATSIIRDTLGRPLRDLRISVTDRCNFRCPYCMPRKVFGHDYNWLPRADILSFEEMTRAARIFMACGVEKIRITGGEPLLRRDLSALIEKIAVLPGLHDLALTTNGVLLRENAYALRKAGLHRITVSLDALDEAKFRTMSDSIVPLDRVINGIEAAREVGFEPIKINVVVRRGWNEDQILPLARRFSGPGWSVRFIEYMDVGTTNGWRLEDVVPAEEILNLLHTEFVLEPVPASTPGETARRFRQRSGGEIGIIASVTAPFCRGCTRARLTADGQLYPCLFSACGFDLRASLRDGSSDAAVFERIQHWWAGRGDRYSEIRTADTPPTPRLEMSRLGG